MDVDFNEHLLQYDDATLSHYILECESYKHSSGAFLLSPNVIAKYSLPAVQTDMLQAIECTRLLGVRVPGIKWEIETHGTAYIFMERIHEQTLEEACIHLPWYTILRLACQLCRFVRWVKAASSITAGTLFIGVYQSESSPLLSLLSTCECSSATFRNTQSSFLETSSRIHHMCLISNFKLSYV